MTTKPVVILIVIIISGFMMMNYACKSESEFSSLRWPPDTIKAVWVEGHTYDVTTSPVAEDPKMQVVLIWPPDTMGNTSFNHPGSAGPDPTFFRTVSSVTPVPAAAFFRNPPDGYPLEIHLIWPPDTMAQ